MRYVRFVPPTDHYDKRIEAVDEEICTLIKKRKDLSDENPGFPTKQLIASWAEKFDFYEDFLNSLFHNFLNEEMYKPQVEPEGFVKNIPLLKTFEKKEKFYTLTFVQQFENASVVHLHMDENKPVEMEKVLHRHYQHFELSVEAPEIIYNCRLARSSGSGEHMSYKYVVSPALPDDRSKYTLVFKEFEEPFGKPTGFEFSM
ncbi:hypothetical protein [Lysinibacillus sp. 3P01SB]|uniref:hypothetical protein n=1 Tax=Lysinibacillus sp. 3P01SB TaxID=3132284 RepID=UPI0039A6627C